MKYLAAAALALAASGCAKFDHLGKPPTMSPLAGPVHAIDPAMVPPGGWPNPYGYNHAQAYGYGYPPPGYGYPPTGHPGGYPQPAPHGYSDANAAPTQQQRRIIPASLRRGGTHASDGASLWSSGPQSLFGDRRAQGVGDIVTIVIDINDEAEMRNQTNRNRSGSDSVEVPSLFGFEKMISKVLPGEGLEAGIEAETASSTNGNGQTTRNEAISLKVAARVVEVLPNGHFVVTGNQEVRVNFELRDLQVAGIIRPEDISRRNEITYDRMANARISYGGRGQITDLQQPRYGRQVIEAVSPF